MQIGGEGCTAFLSAFQVGQAGPDRDAEAALDLVAVVDALVQQVEEVQRHGTNHNTQRECQKQHQQAFREHPAGVEGGVFDGRDIADLAVVQLTVNTRFFQAVLVQRIAFLCRIQFVLQARKLRLQIQCLLAVAFQLRDLRILLNELGLQARVAGLLIGVHVLHAVVDGVGSDAFRALDGGFLFLEQLLEVVDLLIDRPDWRRLFLERAEHFLTLHFLAVDAVLQVLAIGVQRQFATCRDCLGLLCQLLFQQVQAGLGRRNGTGCIVTLGTQIVEPLRGICQALGNTHCAQLVQVILDLLLVLDDVRASRFHFRFIERVQADPAQCLGTLQLILGDPGPEHGLGDVRVVPGKSQLHHRRARFVADLEVFLQILGQTFGLRAVLHQTDKLQNVAHAVDDCPDDCLEAVLHRRQNAGFGRHHRQLGEVFLGHCTHDRPSAEHALFIEQRITQAARYHDGLTV
ncbi:hypothetical protein ALR00_05388 [Pseudomonas savastanoi pv. retacarpa]|nr:hypothetical protein ALR00_05388 [Pseudomonas savastanoi pv. retacarpa]